MAVQTAREVLRKIYNAALGAVAGRARVRAHLEADPLPGRVHLIAVGKAACAMAQGALDALGSCIVDALVVTKHGYATQLPWPVLECGHPLPDAASLDAGARLASYVEAIETSDAVLVLISGGASALVELPVAGVNLGILRDANRWLLGSGLPIETCNRVRKRLSRLKAGGLGRMLAPRPVLGLFISDVSGDDPRTIGSGLLSSHRGESLQLDAEGFPAFLQPFLAARVAAAASVSDFASIRLAVIATLADAERAADEAARRLGYPTRRHARFVDGDAVVAGEQLAMELLEAPVGLVHIWGGEPTMVLPSSPGRGGRCQQAALAAAARLRGSEGVLLIAGTDGSDGPGKDAGAIVDGNTASRGEQAGHDVRDCLRRADAGTFLAATGDLLATGPTGTNVMDLMLGLREGR